jgi:hypothetical protein
LVGQQPLSPSAHVRLSLFSFVASTFYFYYKGAIQRIRIECSRSFLLQCIQPYLSCIMSDRMVRLILYLKWW